MTNRQNLIGVDRPSMSPLPIVQWFALNADVNLIRREQITSAGSISSNRQTYDFYNTHVNGRCPSFRSKSKYNVHDAEIWSIMNKHSIKNLSGYFIRDDGTLIFNTLSKRSGCHNHCERQKFLHHRTRRINKTYGSCLSTSRISALSTSLRSIQCFRTIEHRSIYGWAEGRNKASSSSGVRRSRGFKGVHY